MPRPKKAKEAKEAAPAAVECGGCDAPVKLKGRVAGGDTGAWNIFDQEDMIEEQKELMGFAKDSTEFCSMAEINTEVLPLPWPAMQYLIGRIGIPLRTYTQIIGPECVAKSSLAQTLAYYFIKNNIPTGYFLSEPKELQADWGPRLTGKDPELGVKCLKRVPRIVATDYFDMDTKIRDWVKTVRKDQSHPVPLHIPVVVIIDSLSHMRTPVEREAQMNGKKAKEGEVNWGVVEKGSEDVNGRIGSAASFMASWCRTFSEVMKELNVTVIAISGQSVKIPMGMGPAAMAGCTDANNGESIGGRAIKKAAGIRINMTQGSKLTKGSGEAGITYGAKIKMRLLKNSYGPKGNKITFDLRDKMFDDKTVTDPDGCEKVVEYEQAIDMDGAFCDALCIEKACGCTCTGGLYTAPDLGVERMRAASVMRHLNENPALLVKACRALGIAGYEEA